MASETSFALPKPYPTRPLWSPATINALKLKRRPPFTTLAHRLMNTTFSVVSPFAGGVRSVVRESLRLPWLPAYAILEFESAFARRVSQCFYFAVVKKSTPIENRLVDLFREQTL